MSNDVFHLCSVFILPLDNVETLDKTCNHNKQFMFNHSNTILSVVLIHKIKMILHTRTTLAIYLVTNDKEVKTERASEKK